MTGSGFIIQINAHSTYIVTNYHVVADAPNAVYVMPDGEKLQAEISAWSEAQDLCLLNLTGAPVRTPLSFAAEDARHGDAVYAVGFPAAADNLSDTPARSSEEATITDGIIGASRTATLSDSGTAVKLLQFNAAINPGNSGGPLFDETGAVVGVNTYSTYDSQGIFGAVCASEVTRFLESNGISPSIAKHHASTLPWILSAAGLILLIVIILLVTAMRRRKRAAQDPDAGNVSYLHVVKEEPDAPVQPRKRHVLPRRWIAVLIVVVLLLAACGGYILTYQKAVRYADSGDYDAAAKALFFPAITRLHDKELPDYLDAYQLLEDGKFEEAEAAFTALGSYRDSESQVLAAQYQSAMELIQQTEYDAARTIFEDLSRFF